MLDEFLYYYVTILCYNNVLITPLIVIVIILYFVVRTVLCILCNMCVLCSMRGHSGRGRGGFVLIHFLVATELVDFWYE